MSVVDKFLDIMRVNDDFDDDDDFFDDEEFDDDEDLKPRRSLFGRNKSEEEKAEKAEKKEAKRQEKLEAQREKEEKRQARREEAQKEIDDLDDPFDKGRSSRKSLEPIVKPVRKTKSSKVTPMRKRAGGSSQMEVIVIKPLSMEDTREIADALLEDCTAVLNLEGLDMDVAQRIIDFSSGVCYSLQGGLQKISSYIFILTPENVEITGDYEEIVAAASDLPNIRSSY